MSQARPLAGDSCYRPRIRPAELTATQLAHVERRLAACPDLRAMVLHRELRTDHDYTGSYTSLRRRVVELARRADCRSILPNDAAAIQLAGALLIEQNAEWQVERRYLSQESLAPVLEDQRDAEHEERQQILAA